MPFLRCWNASLEILRPDIHRQECPVAERLASMKVALCRVGSWFFVPGERRELGRALALRADIRDEQSFQALKWAKVAA